MEYGLFVQELEKLATQPWNRGGRIEYDCGIPGAICISYKKGERPVDKLIFYIKLRQQGVVIEHFTETALVVIHNYFRMCVSKNHPFVVVPHVDPSDIDRSYFTCPLRFHNGKVSVAE